jgi:hypothetical protein
LLAKEGLIDLSFLLSFLPARYREVEMAVIGLVERVFKSKIDTWLLAVFVGSAAMALFAAGVLIQGSASDFWVGFPIVVLGAVFPFWLMVRTTYTFEDGVLHIRSGPFKWVVQVSDIRSVTPTRNPLSSPALSLDRLNIVYGNGQSVMISPLDKAGFLEHLEKCRSNLQ